MDLDRIMERLFRLSHQIDQPAQPLRGRTAKYVRCSHATRAPHSAQPPALRRARRKAAHEARRRQRSAR